MPKIIALRLFARFVVESYFAVYWKAGQMLLVVSWNAGEFQLKWSQPNQPNEPNLTQPNPAASPTILPTSTYQPINP